MVLCLPVNSGGMEKRIMESSLRKMSIARLIFWPAVITLGITFLRVEGELRHWSSVWFNRSAGGGGAIIGISWLPLFFGPYFALKLARENEGPVSYGKAVGAAAAGLVVLFGGGFVVGATESHPGILTLFGFLIMLGAAFIPVIGWRSVKDDKS